MIKTVNRKEQARKRHQRVRLKISGDAQWPRLAVYRSTKHIYAQVIDDVNGVTLASSSSKVKEFKRDDLWRYFISCENSRRKKDDSKPFNFIRS